MSTRNNLTKLTFMSMAIVINMVGAFIAVQFKLLVFIDTIGTFLSAFLFGPLAGILTGAATSIINGLTFDPYSLYFIPQQITVGLIAGICYKKGLFKGKLFIVGTTIVTIFASIVGAIICAYVFGGITSSGTAFVVMYLKNLGLNEVVSVFLTQIIFDWIDKGIVSFIALRIIVVLPRDMKQRIKLIRYSKEGVNGQIQ